ACLSLAALTGDAATPTGVRGRGSTDGGATGRGSTGGGPSGAARTIFHICSFNSYGALGSHKALEWASQLGCLEVFLEGSPRDVIVQIWGGKQFMSQLDFGGSSRIVIAAFITG
ncbi:hypothetical protein MKW92_037009, partial [Papaver armeniacum]